MATIEEIEARRAERAKALAEARAEQLGKDLEALDRLEEEHGTGRVVRVEVAAFTPGLPTCAIVCVPSEEAFKRLRDQLRRAKDGVARGAAQDLLGEVCRVYPDAQTYAAMRAKSPGLHDAVSVAAMRLADAEAAEQGKG